MTGPVSIVPVAIAVAPNGGRRTKADHPALPMTPGALLGGHVRVGFENNLLLPNRPPARDNAALVATARTAIEACSLRTADADALREAWSLAG